MKIKDIPKAVGEVEVSKVTGGIKWFLGKIFWITLLIIGAFIFYVSRN